MNHHLLSILLFTLRWYRSPHYHLNYLALYLWCILRSQLSKQHPSVPRRYNRSRGHDHLTLILSSLLGQSQFLFLKYSSVSPFHNSRYIYFHLLKLMQIIYLFQEQQVAWSNQNALLSMSKDRNQFVCPKIWLFRHENMKVKNLLRVRMRVLKLHAHVLTAF